MTTEEMHRHLILILSVHVFPCPHFVHLKKSFHTVADPRPSDKGGGGGGGGHPDPEIRGGPGLKKKNQFQLFGPRSKKRGGQAPRAPLQ